MGGDTGDDSPRGASPLPATEQPAPFPDMEPEPRASQEARRASQEGADLGGPAEPARGPRVRTSTIASVTSTATAATSRLRSTSIKLLNADAPLGMWAASSQVAARAPTIGEIREQQFVGDGWQQEVQRHYKEQRRASIESSAKSSPVEGRGRKWSLTRRSSTGLSGASDDGKPTLSATVEGKRRQTVGDEAFPALEEEDTLDTAPSRDVVEVLPSHTQAPPPLDGHSDGHAGGAVTDDKQKLQSITAASQPLPPYLHPLPSGYIPPPKLPWTTSTAIALSSFWRWFLTPAGFLITLYGLNVVAWGGMLFLLLCNAAPAMCHPTCNDINSPRRVWIEIDSQILNALFCVTGFGLAPWRFRDLWWLLVYRLGLRGRDAHARTVGLRRLAGIHRGWFRLPASDHLGPGPAVPPAAAQDPHAVLDDERTAIPASKTPDDPLTGVRAPPTKVWKMDFVVWMNVWNTFLQAVLCGFMWGMTRYNRPSWATGLFIGLACLVAGVAGIMMYKEGSKVKRVEGVLPKLPPDYEAKAVADVEMGPNPHGSTFERDKKR